jgi:hypothetical protein
MIPGKLKIEPFTAGDTWRGVPTFSIRVNGAAPSFPIAMAVMRFQKATAAMPNPPFELASNTTKLIVTSVANWELKVPPQIVPQLTAGDWDFQIKITDSQGTLETYIADTFTVLKTI